jgi:hypothetical protein
MWILNKLRDQRGEFPMGAADPDQLTDEEKAQLELEAKGEAPETPPPETPPPETPAPETPPVTPPPTPDDRQRLARELQRAQERERRLKENNEATQREIAALRQEQIQWRARQQMEEEARNKAQETARAASRPDPEIDPIGAELWDLKEFRRQQEEREKARTADAERMRLQQEQQAREQEIDTQVFQYLREEREAFLEEHPDYDQVTTPVFEGLKKLYNNVGWNDQAALYLTNNTVKAIALSGRQNGKSTHQAIYEFAKEMRANPGQMQKVIEEGKQGTNGNQPPVQKANEKIAAIKKAQSLSGLGKTPQERNIDADNILAMSETDLANLSDDDYIRIKQSPELGPLLQRRLEQLG